ncbi:MAG TPA: diacylglycerol kinase family protein [Parapedobacter sp.]|uniref:diacylglycerol/lipid kinase family protein n=1 Tax=Parapedobacter sp. TaxID=1958893 RepID=UPI002BA6CAA6|nr:diacylglycerol kinase family protein [Parapedobacter sp.]HWK58400.1 diacylglycerol kinase family protein [Parapedobacter sp.]
MKKNTHARLLHNPKAGDQDHVKEELIRRIESLGFTCQYASLKEKGWKRFASKTALVVIAGGDGTVREVLKKLLTRSILDKPLTVALIPSGTANNFAKTLGISPDLDTFERNIQQWKPKQVDVGLIGKLGKARFFIEGLGFGLIPTLMEKMKTVDFDHVHTAEDELELALEKLLEIVETSPATRAKVTIDGLVYEDDYLLVEVLNIKSIGPNLVLASSADPTDGNFEVALLKQSNREVFSTYLRRLRQQVPQTASAVPWQIVTATREVVIDSDGQTIHVDDELITLKKRKKIEITIRAGVIDILT